ncbi:MAG: DUF2779 domain-containing protein [Acholeplasmataceae bacterium]|nr:DUF2779 domain-containing protein [Acholeplasmataceae bacterium]
MKISKTRFMHYIKNVPYPKEIVKRLSTLDSEIEFNDIKELLKLENESRRKIILETMSNILEEDADNIRIDNDKLNEKDTKKDILSPYLKKIEALVARKVNNIFGGMVVQEQDTFDQPYYQIEQDGYDFFAFLDTRQEDETTVRIIETKATTSNKFLELSYKINKESYPIFIKNSLGVWQTKATLGRIEDKQYLKKIEKLLDKKDRAGQYVYDLAYQRYIIENSNNKKKHQYYLAVLNSDYVFDGRYDNNGEPIYSDDIITIIDLTDITEQLMESMQNDIAYVIDILNHMDLEAIKLEETLMKGDILIQSKYRELIGIEYPITEFNQYHHGFGEDKISVQDLINQGIRGFDQMPENFLVKPNQIIQYKAFITEQQHIQKDVIRQMISQLKYPLYHLDFETFPCPLPRYIGEKPYEQSVFQFSLHIESEPGLCDKEINHVAFLSKDHEDRRREIVEALLQHIKNDGGNIIAYHASFEKKVLSRLADIFSEYAQELNQLINRAYDLKDIIKNNKTISKSLGLGADVTFNFYDKRQHGSFSIKKILPIFSDLSYQGMNVSNGNDALVGYALLPKLKRENQREYDTLYHDMLQYCKQDTWAMVLILNELRQSIEK